MTASNVRHSDATKAGNVATPHAPVDGKVAPIAPFDSDNTNPAGGINSNADDMAKWLLVQLARAQLADGSRCSSRQPRGSWGRSSRRSRSATGRRSCALRPPFNGYGLGLGVRDYRGHKLLTHTGGLPGLRVEGGDDPRRASSASRSSPTRNRAPPSRRSRHILDATSARRPRTGLPPSRRSQKRGAAANARRRATGRGAARAASKPSLPLADVRRQVPRRVVRRHDHRVRWRQLDDQVRRSAAAHGHTRALAARHVRGALDDRELRADAFVTFALNPDGTIDTVKMRAVSPDTDFSYDFQDLLFKRPDAVRFCLTPDARLAMQDERCRIPIADPQGSGTKCVATSLVEARRREHAPGEVAGDDRQPDTGGLEAARGLQVVTEPERNGDLRDEGDVERALGVARPCKPPV